MVMSAAKHPTWLHKVITHATEYQNLTRTPSLAKGVNDNLSQQRDPQLRNKLNSKPVPSLGPQLSNKL